MQLVGGVAADHQKAPVGRLLHGARWRYVCETRLGGGLSFPIAGRGNELSEGFTPDDHGVVAGGVDASGERHDKVVEGLHRPDMHHPILQAGKVRLGLDEGGQ